MDKHEFKEFWQRSYPGTVPIVQELREVFKDRWLQIPTLPDVKDPVENEAGYDLLLKRQNAMISEFFTHQEEFYILWGQYSLVGEKIETDLSHEIAALALHRVSMEDYKMGSWYRLFLKKENWTAHKFDSLLKEIARDGKRVLFIGKDQECLLAPSPGSMDIFLKDSESLNHWQQRLREWKS